MESDLINVKFDSLDYDFDELLSCHKHLTGNVLELRRLIELLQKENECRKSECDLLINSNKQIMGVLARLESDIDDLDYECRHER